MTEEAKAAVKPFKVSMSLVTSDMICAVIDRLADAPLKFKASDLHGAVFVDGEPFLHARSEALNRLMQRWRKLGLCVFERGGRWRLTTVGWGVLQHAQREARALQSGAAGEVGK